jgi:hypothetical protein
LALNGNRRHLDRDAGLKGRGPGRIGLIGALAAVSQNDIIQLISGDVGPPKNLGDHGGSQLVRPDGFKGFSKFSYWCAGRRNNDNIVWIFQNNPPFFIFPSILNRWLPIVNPFVVVIIPCIFCQN